MFSPLKFNRVVFKQLAAITLWTASSSVLASGAGLLNSSALLGTGVSTQSAAMMNTPQLLILAEPEEISFELEGVGLVEVEVDLRQQEGENRLIKGRLRQGEVLLPYSAVTLIQSDQGLTGSLRTLESSWLVSAGAAGVRLLGASDAVAAVENTSVKPVFLPIAVRAVKQLVTQVISASNYREWQAEKVYAGGELVRYQGRIYRASWWHHSQQPKQASTGPWQQIDS